MFHENLVCSTAVEVVVGKMIGDGIGITFQSNHNISGVQFCVPLPDIDYSDWNLHVPPVFKGLVISDVQNFEDFTILTPLLPLDAQVACIELNGTNISAFPIGYGTLHSARADHLANVSQAR